VTLPELPYAGWEPTQSTLHLWSQIVGKIALRASALRNHWWNCTLKPTPRGLRTDRLHDGARGFEIELDFIEHRALVRAADRDGTAFSLHDGLSVAEFYAALYGSLAALGIAVPILAKPYGVPRFTTPFAQDREHDTYDAALVQRWWQIVRWSSDVMESFASDFAGKQGPVQLFWHSFDLALGRYSGRRAPGPPPADPVAREAYTHEVIAFGFWAGDPNTRAAAYYTYTAPEPAALTAQPLRPAGAAWIASGAGHLGTVGYDTIRTAADPRSALLDFLNSGYTAGAQTAAWNTADLAHR
jgi:hypothetical protein